MAFYSQRKFYGILFLAVIIGWCSKTGEFVKEGEIEAANPKDVWLFVRDFSNMKTLNPTIFKFVLMDEMEDLRSYNYTVEYMERLSHWPYTINENVGEINAMITEEEGTKFYLINSITKTCFLGGIYCLHSRGSFEFRRNSHGGGTIYKERVNYGCPPIPFMSYFCRREVEFQRNEIFVNLKGQFRP